MRFQLIFLITASLMACESSVGIHNEYQNSLLLALDSMVNAEHKANKFDGLLTVRKSGALFYSKAKGIASREWKIPMRTNHRFDICSMNKSFIAALILKAVELGHFKLEDKLMPVLDKYDLPGNYPEEITIHQMLCHLSGLNDYDGTGKEYTEDNFLKLKRQRFTNQEYTAFLARVPLVGEPGKQFYYSNFAYHILCILIEEAFESDFDSILQQHIAIPLGLENTFASSINEEIKPELVKGYNYLSDRSEWMSNDFIDLSLGRRIFSTAEDLALWTESVGAATILTPDSWTRMLTNHVSSIQSDMSYGYGWVIFDGQSSYKMGQLPTTKPYFIHGGNTGGYRGITVNINKGEWVFSVLSNVGDRFNEMEFAQKITQLINAYEN